MAGYEDGGLGPEGGAAVPEVLLTGEPGARGLAIAGPDLYWLTGTSDDANMVRVRRGTTAPTDLSGPVRRPAGVFIDGAYAYWSADNGGNCVPTAFRRRTDDPSDAEASVVASCSDAFWGLGAMAVDGVAIYWATPPRQRVYRALLPTGTPPELGVAPDAQAASVGGVAVNATTVYWTDPIGGEVLAWSKATQEVSIVATRQATPREVVATATDLYWTTLSSVVHLALTPSAVPEAIASAQDGPTALRVDARGVYWATHDGLLRRATPTGIETLAASSATSIALGPDAIFWTTTEGAIMRLAQ